MGNLDHQIPVFKESDVCRRRYHFSGTVQQVGFRIETKLLADKLGLTGKAINLYDGSVEVEVQGEIEKIHYLVKALYHVKRFQIENCEEEEMEYQDNEKEFIIGSQK